LFLSRQNFTVPVAVPKLRPRREYRDKEPIGKQPIGKERIGEPVTPTILFFPVSFSSSLFSLKYVTASDHPRWYLPHPASQWLSLAVCYGHDPPQDPVCCARFFFNHLKTEINDTLCLEQHDQFFEFPLFFSEYLLTMHRSGIMIYDSTFKNELFVMSFRDDNDCFYYHSWINNTSSAFETLSSFIVVTLQLNNCTNVLKIMDSKANEASSEAIRLFLLE